MHGSTSDPIPEPGLFVIWETGRKSQYRILDDLAANFHINRVTEFRWTPSMVWANYQRFYSDTPIRGSAHARNKGLGPFLAINVSVNSAAYDHRLTRNRGVRVVNTEMFDAKTRYREWTDGFGIHCGENISESLRDTYMLYGSESDNWVKRKLPRWNGTIDIVEQDPMGALGWRSFDELFGVLNRAVNYALICYGPTAEVKDCLSRGHSFDILTSDYYAAHTILHNGPRIPEPLRRGGTIEIRVDDKPVKLNLRYPGDGQFDEKWATAILDKRVMDSHGFYRPKDEEQYWLMARHVVAERAPIDLKFLQEAQSIASDEHLLKYSSLPTDDAALELHLTNQLVQRGILRPKKHSRLGNAFDVAMESFRHRYQILTASIRTLYFASRDTVLAHLPILSSIKKALIQDTGIGKPR
jgi:hypothetical protein